MGSLGTGVHVKIREPAGRHITATPTLFPHSNFKSDEGNEFDDRSVNRYRQGVGSELSGVIFHILGALSASRQEDGTKYRLSSLERRAKSDQGDAIASC